MPDPTPSRARLWRPLLGVLAIVLIVAGLTAWALPRAGDEAGERSFASGVALDTPAPRAANYQEFHERYGDQVAGWGVNWNDTQPDGAIGLLAETGATYAQDLDLDLGTPLRVRGLPMLVLVEEHLEVRL